MSVSINRLQLCVSVVKNTKQLICNSLQSSINIDGEALYYKINGIANVSNSIEFVYTEITLPATRAL